MTAINDKKDLAVVERLLHSTKTEDRALAGEMIKRLSESDDTVVARAAIELTRRFVSVESPESPTLRTLANEWMALRSPMHETSYDYRFIQWFAQAEAQPELLSALAPRMLSSAYAWLEEYERESGVATNDDEPRLRNFDAWAELLSKRNSIAAVMAEVLDRWAELRRRRRVAIGSRAINAAIARGDIDAARNAFDALRNAPHVPAESVADLGRSIDELARHGRDIDAWRDELPGIQRDWRDVARLYDVWARGRRLAQAPRTPGAWADGIADDLTQLQTLAAGFITQCASGCQSLDDLLRELGAMQSAARSVAASAFDESWLEPLIAAMMRVADREVELARDPAALHDLSGRVAVIASGLPEAGRVQVDAVIRRIDAIANAWSALDSSGLGSVIPAGVVPAKFAAAVANARALNERIAAIEQSLTRSGTTAELLKACATATAALDEILAASPQLANAGELRRAVAERMKTLRIDRAIEHWDLDGLRAIASESSFDGAYATVAAAVPVLERLAVLRAQSFVPADLDSIAGWWTSWRGEIAQLPAGMPCVLTSGLEKVRLHVAAAVRDVATNHLSRSASLKRDRAIETAVAELTADLGLSAELTALTKRRSLHEAIEHARGESLLALALLLRDSWALIEHYLPSASAILNDVFERAWNDADEGALDALRYIAFDAQSGGGNERLVRWREWLALESRLAAAVTPDSARLLRSSLENDEPGAPLSARRLARIVAAWRVTDDDPALVWAYRAFRHMEPGLFPGSDPLVSMTRKSDRKCSAVLGVVQSVAMVNEAFIHGMSSELERVESEWQRLESLLVGVPVEQTGPWPAPPAMVQTAKNVIQAFQIVLSSLARWKESDLRPLGDECDAIRTVLLRDLNGYPAAEPLQRLLRKLEPLTRLHGLEEHLRQACRRCMDPLSDEAPDLFAYARQCVEALEEALRSTEPEGSTTRQAAAAQYWSEVPRLAGDCLLPDAAGTLDALCRRLDALHENDVVFRTAIEALRKHQPVIGAAGHFDPYAHDGYLTLYPRVAPASLRTRRIFDDFAARFAQRAILSKSSAQLPQWLQTYADNIAAGAALW
jgi:hypothetical protein